LGEEQAVANRKNAMAILAVVFFAMGACACKDRAAAAQPQPATPATQSATAASDPAPTTQPAAAAVPPVVIATPLASALAAAPAGLGQYLPLEPGATYPYAETAATETENLE